MPPPPPPPPAPMSPEGSSCTNATPTNARWRSIRCGMLTLLKSGVTTSCIAISTATVADLDPVREPRPSPITYATTTCSINQAPTSTRRWIEGVAD